MNVLSKIFSSGATELIKGVGGVLDNLTTSKEEKLEAQAKIKDMIMIGAYFGGRSLEKVKK